MSAAHSRIFRRAVIARAVGAALCLATLGATAADAPVAAVKSAKPGKAAKPVAAPAYKPIVEEKAMALRWTTIAEGIPSKMMIRLVNGKDVFW